MLSLDQLSQMVKEHLGLYSSDDGVLHSSKWEISESSVGGRGLIATEDIIPGEVLYVDHPLISGPRAASIEQGGCTACYRTDTENVLKCSKCGLLLCSEQCQNGDVHFNDCSIISRWDKKVPVEEFADTTVSRALTAIRALLLSEDQKQLLSVLQAHMLPQHGTEIRDLKQFFEIPESEEDLMRLACCVLDANAYQIAIAYGKKEMSRRGLYPVASLMNHNCVPNTRYSYNSDAQMTVKALKHIRAGCEIFTCYTGFLWGTPSRQTQLYKTKHFLCKCDRCADPTERGTFLAALKCFVTECPGSIVPIQPLNMSSAWQCLECGLRVPRKNVGAVQSAIGSLLGSIDFGDVDHLETYLANRITKYIPKSNQVVVDLQCRLICEFGEVEGLRYHGHGTLISLDGRLQSAAACAAWTPYVTRSPVAVLTMAHLSTMEVLKEHLATRATNATCLCWDVKRSKLGGRGLFATKFIEKGSLIFTNKPLVIGPRADQNKETFCTTCFEISKTCVLCEKCYLMVCSEDCKKSRHAQKCNFITSSWKLEQEFENKAGFMTGILIYLQCLLLTNKQIEMLSRLQRSDSSTIDWSELKTLIPENIIPVEQIKFMTMCSEILKINSFRISKHSQKQKVPLRGLYPISAFLNHSCVPNTRNEFSDDYTMAVYASKDIEVGEEIVSSYTGLLWCTPARRLQLYKTKRFWCTCDRCADSSEMGTRLSALRCLDKECVGLLLPVTPLDPRCEWRCDNCGALEPPARVNMVQGVLGSLLVTLNLDNQLQLETFVLERLAALIPYSNHIFVDLRLRLELKLGFADDMKLFELSESRLSLKETLCRGTLRTVAALGAGDAHLRGLLLYHLHAALAERARRSPDLFEDLKPEIESTIEQAYSILNGDISAPPDLELRRRYLGPGCDKPQEERFFILDA